MPLLLLFPFLEIYLFYKFVMAYSFLDGVILLVMSGVVGSLIIRLLGASTFSLFQRELSAGRIPANHLIHRSFVILGGILLFIPGILSDVMGLLCILPGTRHLMVWYFKRMIARGVLKGRVFMSGFGMPGGFGGRFGGAGGFGGPRGFPPGGGSSGERVERDAQVVDIEPIEITHTKKKD